MLMLDSEINATDLVALSAGVSVGELVDLPGGVLLGELLLDVLVGEVLHAPSVYLVQRAPPLLGRVDVRRGLKRTLLKLQRTVVHIMTVPEWSA